MSYAMAQYGFERDLARDFAEYAKKLDTQIRERRGIMIFAGRTPDLDRAYQFPVHLLSEVAKTLEHFKEIENANQDTRYLFFFGATPDEDQVFALDMTRFDRFRDAMPDEMLRFSMPHLQPHGIDF